MRREPYQTPPVLQAEDNVSVQLAGSSLLSAIAATTMLALLSGCSVLRAPEPGATGYEYRSEWVRPASDRQSSSSSRANRKPAVIKKSDSRESLIAETNRWMGTPYSYGGDSRSGIDCSAFVQVLYRNAFDVELPRSTDEQRTVGERIRRTRLAVGDLLFFDTGPRQNHVGVYLGGDEFAHASSSSGVTVSNLSDSYWSSRFEEGIRPESVETDEFDLEPLSYERQIPPSVSSSVDPAIRRGW